MLPPETSTIHGQLHAVPGHSPRAVLRARSSCVETCENRSEKGPDCTVDNQTAPIRTLPQYHSNSRDHGWFRFIKIGINIFCVAVMNENNGLFRMLFFCQETNF
ncbi:hypothetical protein AVEN_121921-1 [Araneus ventricosus]|uniref:Uncharacterized protein n=1 Tax=Araneus ventricosus TaxID=182803 RepID=A0A4Y2UEG4_ARAVE|nr:hypothetical protein AVEN_121921-1 [Araneus ventricosus]